MILSFLVSLNNLIFKKVNISKNIFYIGYSKQVKMKDNLGFRTGSTKVIHWFRQSTENE